MQVGDYLGSYHDTGISMQMMPFRIIKINRVTVWLERPDGSRVKVLKSFARLMYSLTAADFLEA